MIYRVKVMGDDTTAVTRLLQRWQDGDRDALEAITALPHHAGLRPALCRCRDGAAHARHLAMTRSSNRRYRYRTVFSGEIGLD
jgi:hypothetical protein